MLDANINVPQDAVYGVDRKPDVHVFFQWVLNEDTGKKCGHYDLLIPRDTASGMIPNDSDDTIQWLQPTVPFYDGLSDEAMLCHELPIEFRFDINSKEQTTQAVAETAQQSAQPEDTAHASTEAHQEQHTEQDKTTKQTTATEHTEANQHAAAATKMDQQQEHSSDEKDKESHDTTATAAKPPTIQQDDLQPPLPEPKNMPDPDPQQEKAADEQTPPINTHTHTTSATEHAEAATKMDQQQEHSSGVKDKESHDTTAIAAKPPTIQQDDLQPPLPEPKNMPIQIHSKRKQQMSKHHQSTHTPLQQQNMQKQPQKMINNRNTAVMRRTRS